VTPRDTGWDAEGDHSRGGRHGRPEEESRGRPAGRHGVDEPLVSRDARDPRDPRDPRGPRPGPHGRAVPEPRRHPGDTGENRRLDAWGEAATEHIRS